jgi:hypothetical protein
MDLRLAAVSALLATLLAHPLASQTPEGRPGRVVGTVLDEAGAPVPGAQVRIAASGGPSVTAGLDGRYLLANVPAGRIALAVRAIGFSPKTVAGIVVPPGGGVEQNIVLTAQTVQVAEITVSAAAERGSVAAALDEQRSAAGVMNAVTSEQIQRSPDSDAGQALQRVSGVTVQDGRYVFVRGLGERYTTTALNGARIPSPEPERRVVPLDLFPAGLLQDITTTKTFTPDQPGDFTGAAVNLRTREFPLRRVFSFGFGMGYNSAVTGRTMGRAPTVGREWLGFAGDARTIPVSAASAPRDFSGLSQADVQAIIGDFRNVWSAASGAAAPNTSLSTSVGGEDYFGSVPLGYIASLSYSASNEIRQDEQRARGDAAGGGTAIARNQYRGGTTTASVLWGGMLNLTARLGGSTKLTFNNTYSRTADNTVTRLLGHWEEFDIDADITRISFTERSVRSNQIAGEHLLGMRHGIEWSVTSSAVRRYEPDRSDLIYDVSPGVNYWFGSSESGVRTFADLHESATNVSGAYQVTLGEARQTSIKVGASTRTTDRDADARAYQIVNNNLSEAERSVPPEQIFNRPADLTAIPDAQVGRYTANERVNAGYVQLEFPLGERLRVVGGARVEQWDLNLVSGTEIAGELDTTDRRNTDVLPGVALTFRLSERTSMRVSASQTLSRPEYRELAQVTTRDVAGGYDSEGNPNLVRSLVQNYDARWEFYPTRGEVISIGLFAKRFDRPIERVLKATSGAPRNTWVNARAATNYGLEVELRHSLGSFAQALMPFSLFANGTLMSSRIELDTDSLALSSRERAMVGQSPYVVNLGLGYTNGSGSYSATLLYNVVGRRIDAAATTNLPDSYEEQRQALDVSLRFPVLPGVSGKADFKNLLDSPVHTTQGDVTRLRYRTGRQFSVGLSWQP